MFKAKFVKRNCYIIFIALLFIFIKIFLDFVQTLIHVKFNTFCPSSDNYETVFLLDNILEVNQNPDYPTGCESVSLYILLKYYDIDVDIEDIVSRLPKADIPEFFCNGVFAENPERIFFGNPKSSYSYGVYNAPIAQTANFFKKNAISKNGLTLSEIKWIIQTGNPLIIWTSIYEDFREPYISKYWYDCKTGKKISWISGEHAVVVYGYDENNFYISNPYNGKKYGISNDIFEFNYNKFGKRSVFYFDKNHQMLI